MLSRSCPLRESMTRQCGIPCSGHRFYFRIASHADCELTGHTMRRPVDGRPDCHGSRRQPNPRASTRNGKRKCSSRPIIRCRPQTSVMGLDNGAADGESDSHAVGFGRVEPFEDLVRCFRRENRLLNLSRLAGPDSPSSRSVLISNTFGRSSTVLIASAAFRSKFRMTC